MDVSNITSGRPEWSITSAADIGTVPPELGGCFALIFFRSAAGAVFKVPGVE